MFKQVAEAEWKEVGNPIPICSLAISVEEFAEKHELSTFSYLEDGLGQITALVLNIEESFFWVRGPSGIAATNFTQFETRSYERDTSIAFERVCKAFNLDRSDFQWVADNLGRAQWVLSRYDDNNNEVVMFYFHDERLAHMVKRKYEDRGHKQAYFVK